MLNTIKEYAQHYKRRQVNSIGDILRGNGLLKNAIEGKIQMTRRRGRRRKQLLEELEEMRGYCELREEALDRTMWRTGFVRGHGPVVRQAAE
jgi:ribosomal 50S subunit-associated protein YjgA (DUF615 family)